MKQSLQLKVSQQLTLTPQLQQSIRLLQLSTLDLQQEIENILHDNPMLERDEGQPDPLPGASDAPSNSDAPSEAAPEAQEASRDDDGPTDSLELSDWSSSGSGNHDDDFDPHANMVAEKTLREHLLDQLAEHALPPRDRAVVTFLIEELDDDGYLGQSLEELAAHLPEELGVEADELQVGLRLLQQFEPAGVGARSLAESLSLQLNILPDTPVRALARVLVAEHLSLLAHRDFNKLKRQLHCDDEMLKAVTQLVASLNPRPAAGFGRDDTQYIVADVIVTKGAEGWRAQLNPAAMPKLRVNSLYAHLLQHHREGGSQLSAQLQEAKWLIRNVQQRFDTILRVSEAIVARQQQFFELGEVGMRPLVLRDIADELGLHESTISRVTTQKFLLCPRGIFELKYFFGSALETDSGGECSATAIKARLRQLIANEDPKKPLSDSALADMLGNEGIQVARRTVAKYREAMQIPPVNLRKSI